MPSSSNAAALSIPIHILPPPRLGTFTTATRKRYCGFALLTLALLTHSILTVARAFHCLKAYTGQRLAEVGASAGAVVILYYVLKNPGVSLQECNWRCLVVLLIPISYAAPHLLSQVLHSLSPFPSLPCLCAHLTHFLCSCLYAYALIMNGRSSSIVACLKPYRFQMIPVVLKVPGGAYTVPVREIVMKESEGESGKY